MKPEKFVEIARKYTKKCDGKCLHISLIVQKNKILSIGYNSYLRTHPFAYKNNYKYGRIHSELLAITKFPYWEYDIQKCTLINFRFARATNGLLLSKPCLSCLNLIIGFSVKEVVYSTPDGFVKL